MFDDFLNFFSSYVIVLLSCSRVYNVFYCKHVRLTRV